MNRLMIVTLMAMAVLVADAQTKRSTTRRGAVGADGGAAVAQGKDARVQITRKAQVRSACLLSAPSVAGNKTLSATPSKTVCVRQKICTLSLPSILSVSGIRFLIF